MKTGPALHDAAATWAKLRGTPNEAEASAALLRVLEPASSAGALVAQQIKKNEAVHSAQPVAGVLGGQTSIQVTTARANADPFGACGVDVQDQPTSPALPSKIAARALGEAWRTAPWRG